MHFPVLHSSVLAVCLFYMQCFVPADPKLLPHPSSARSLLVTVSLFSVSASLLKSVVHRSLFVSQFRFHPEVVP